MKRILAALFIVFVLSLGTASDVMAQGIPAGTFLDRVSAHPVGDQAERDQAAEAYQSLNVAPPGEVERVLPSVLQQVRVGNEVHIRGYAAQLLLAIALRPDAADLLAAKAEEVSSLIVDSDPVIQRAAVAITDYVLWKPETNKNPYKSALLAGIDKARTPQDVAVDMMVPLLFVGSGDAKVVKSVLDFLNKADLTAETRKQALHDAATRPGLPVELAQLLCKGFDDPDPRVRVSAVIAFATPNSTFHDLFRNRVERMAKDPQEHPQVRELAKQALAGQTSLDPNINVPPSKP